MKRTVTVSFSGDVTLDEGAIWPDKNAPDNWTSADVKHVMEDYGSKWIVLDDWNLTRDLQVTVTVDTDTTEVWS